MRIHFIAIGGSAMHNLAIALKNTGHQVSGSDDEIFEPSKSRLEDYGLLPEVFGWYPDKLSNDIDVVILGMHAREDNPELIRAKELKLNIYSYPEFLFHHSKDKKRIVVGGSHGKTTITAIIMHVLKRLGFNFDYLVGSKIKDFDVMVRLSDESDIMIFEGDEYLSSPIDRRPKFHWYQPHVALISGIAWDHINVFPTFENYLYQFEKFISLIVDEGVLIYNQDDPELCSLIPDSDNLKTIPYSFPDYSVRNGVSFINNNEKEYKLGIFGKHNMQNVLGAKHVCNQLGINDEEFYNSVCSFTGTSNRLELVCEKGSSRLYKDFAHAPSKVMATVRSVKEQFPDLNLLACLELHTFSSLNINFINQYFGALNMADIACVYFNKHTLSMKRLPDLSVGDVKKAFGREDINVTNDSVDLVDWLLSVKKSNSVYLMMSSGNFDGLDMSELANKLL